jgi:hypothetical protein
MRGEIFTTFSAARGGLKVEIRILLRDQTFTMRIGLAAKIAFFRVATTYCAHCKAISLESRGIQ